MNLGQNKRNHLNEHCLGNWRYIETYYFRRRNRYVFVQEIYKQKKRLRDKNTEQKRNKIQL